MSFKAVAAAFFLAALCVTSAQAEDAGEGKVVIALAIQPGSGFTHLAFFFCTPDLKHRDYVTYTPFDVFVGDHHDFDDAAENGTVKIMTMPAGDWKFCMLNETDDHQTAIDAGTDYVSVPFTVKAGETIYLGDYKAVSSTPRTGDYTPAPAQFIVADQSARDVPIAQKKDDKIGAVTVAIPDFATAPHGQYFEREKP